MIKTSKKGEWLYITISKEWDGLSINQLFQEIWKAPKKQTHLLRMNKDVCVNGHPASWVKELNDGDHLQIRLFVDQNFGVIPAYMKIGILYEDDHLLIVNKPAGIDTHPNTPNQLNTLANGVAFYLQAKGEYRQVKHIHRLDRDTSGVILFAKHPLIGAILDKMLEERSIKRTYLALVQGIMKRKKGTINAPIGRDRHHPTRRRVSQNGQNAITHFEVMKTNAKKNTTLVKCTLDTGRTHQIRVHFSHLGHPLLGDSLYGGRPVLHRQALHATEIRFTHPFTLETIACTCSLPSEINIILG